MYKNDDNISYRSREHQKLIYLKYLQRRCVLKTVKSLEIMTTFKFEMLLGL